MFKKKLILSLSIASILAIPFTAFATTSETGKTKNVRGFFKFDASKLTDSQKADLKEYTDKSAQLQKEFINKMISNGSMTEEEGNTALKRIDEKLSNGEPASFLPDAANMRDNHKKPMDFRGKGPGGMGNKGFGRGLPCMEKFDLSKLTDTQKNEISDELVKIANQQKENISTLIFNNIISQEEGDSKISKIDEAIASIKENDLSQSFATIMGEFRDFNPMKCKIDLTDEQKAVLKDNTKKINELKKELMSKMGSNKTVSE